MHSELGCSLHIHAPMSLLSSVQNSVVFVGSRVSPSFSGLDVWFASFFSGRNGFVDFFGWLLPFPLEFTAS